MNVQEMLATKADVLAEPRRFNQNGWIAGSRSEVVLEQRPPCGTAACLGGLTALRHGWLPVFNAGEYDYDAGLIEKDGDVRPVFEVAAEILELTDTEASDLFAFAGAGWPYEAKLAYHKAKTLTEKADAAALAIDWMIAEYETKSTRFSKP